MLSLGAFPISIVHFAFEWLNAYMAFSGRYWLRPIPAGGVETSNKSLHEGRPKRGRLLFT